MSRTVRQVRQVVVGLGSNLGDRFATLREACRRIEAFAPILARSRVWETAPVGGPSQSDFLNAAVLLEWRGGQDVESEEASTLLALLDRLNAIEAELGRVRSVKDGPRTIDLDILWSDGPPVTSARLTVPHPRLAERAFAVAPLLDVVPAAPYVVPPGQNTRLFADQV